jgi:hypothetical protein
LLSIAAVAQEIAGREIEVLPVVKVSRHSVVVGDKRSPAAHPVDNLSPANPDPVDSLSQGNAGSLADQLFQASVVFLANVDSAAAITDLTDHVAESTWVMALLVTALPMDTHTIPATPSIQLILTDRHLHRNLARAAHTIRMEIGSQIPTAIPANRNIRGHSRTTVPIRGNIPQRRTTIINRDIRHRSRATIPINNRIRNPNRTTIRISVSVTISNAPHAGGYLQYWSSRRRIVAVQNATRMRFLVKWLASPQKSEGRQPTDWDSRKCRGFIKVRWLLPDESGFYQPLVLGVAGNEDA